LYAELPQRSLIDIINDFSDIDQIDNSEDLLYTLLRLYAMDKGNANAGLKLREYYSINDFSGSQEFEIRWLVHYVLRMYNKFEQN
jgi:hypothetical protein